MKISEQTKNLTVKSIEAMKLSIEHFNKIDPICWKESVLIFNSLSWELFMKSLILKKKGVIYESDGKSITAEKALNKIHFTYKLVTKEEAQTIGQIISLRNSATHNLLPNVDNEILTHLVHYSLSSFHRLVSKEFKSLSVNLKKDYISISFDGDFTFYSHKVEKLYKFSRKKATEQNELLYLLDRGCKFIESETNSQMISKKEWSNILTAKNKKSRMAYHLSVYGYTNKQENIRYVPVQVAKGYSASVQVSPSKNPNAQVLIKKTDPNKDYPYFTKDLASKLGKSQNFIAFACKRLKIKENQSYCYLFRNNSKGTPVYSDACLNYLKDFLNKNPNYNPFKK